MDLHTDETLNPRLLTLETMADLVLRTGFPHQVTASHCVSLAVQDAKTQQQVAERVAEARIAVVALPQTNLYLQGRDHPVATPRGLTAVRPLRAAGATVAAGGDNLRDPFHPVGRGDALEVAALMVTCGHLSPEAALESVTAAPREALGLPPVRIAPGCPADLVALPAADALEALGAASAHRTVWRAGTIVARTTVRTEIAQPSPAKAIQPGQAQAPARWKEPPHDDGHERAGAALLRRHQEILRRHDRACRRQPGSVARRVRLGRRAVRLRQEHAAAHRQRS